MNFIYGGVLICLILSLLHTYFNLIDGIYIPLVLLSVFLILIGLWKEKKQ